jgi:uncharacterized membrane protein
MSDASPDGPPASVAENIEKILQAERSALQARSHGEAIADAIGGFVGKLAFVVVQVLLSLVWVLWNSGRVPGIRPFDPFPFPFLAAITSLEAVLLSAFVLIKQNRIGTIDTRRDHLDLQINLRTERQVTQIIQMLNKLSSHVGFEHDHDDRGHELGQHVSIEHLVDELHRQLPDVHGG